MTKRFCILLFAALLLILSSCGVNADQRGTGKFDPTSGAVAMICEKTELDGDTASELYRLVVESGLVGELKYVTVWTDAESGEPYYRLRTNDGKREVYIDGGEIIRITDGDIIYLDKNTDIETSPDTSSELTSNADNVTTEDMPGNTESEAPLTETEVETTSPKESYAVTETEQTTAPHKTETEPPQTTPPVTHTYVLNKNSKKFHLPTCSSVNQIKDKNREEFTGDRETLIARGYSPCKRCNP